MMVIGLTGQSGAGKTTLCDYFKEHGFAHINCDETARKAVEKGSKCLSELVLAFGDGILLPDGTLDRKTLSKIVFSDAKGLETLNRITHKYINILIKKELSELRASGIKGCILDAPTLFEAGADKHCDTIVAVLAAKDVRFQRIIKRDGLTQEEAERRCSVQKDDAFFKERCDFVLYNNGSEAEFKASVERLYVEICGIT